MRKVLLNTAAFFAVSVATQANAGSVNVNSPEWLGNLKLDKGQLSKVKTAVESAFDAPIDAEQQCGEVRLDCVVRAAREWTVDGVKYREIVIDVHGLGHSSNAVAQENGKWPAVAAK